ncbi:hypothetical protein [Ralstonia phage RSF1]|uniref:Uncharacterized protein n=1 Tax=Ralstonia phage RSF1 TaxID=1689679 RepID=A0A0K2QQG6_9CAUD|nr:hypothetical protein AVU11_gp025 [Ralstonia phage RSF1]BAS04817.1 hypothetical protein [Ralstonia phage RSF1]
MSNRHKGQHLMQASLKQHQHHQVKDLFIVTESEHRGKHVTSTVHVKVGRHGVEHVKK